MTHEILDNPRAPRVRRVAGLMRKKERFERGEFLVEGPLAVEELLTHAPHLAETVYLDGDLGGSRTTERLANDAGVRVVFVTDWVLAAMADTVTPQGVIAVAGIHKPQPQQALNGAQLVAILHEVRDPGNAGTVLRAADAAGADVVIFSGDSIDPWHPKVVRSTTGSLFHLPVLTMKTLEAAVTEVRLAGLTPIAADIRGAQLHPNDALLRRPVAWVFGNEARGLSDTDRAHTDLALKLPIFGRAESLNLATAASVCLYTTAFAQNMAVQGVDS